MPSAFWNLAIEVWAVQEKDYCEPDEEMGKREGMVLGSTTDEMLALYTVLIRAKEVEKRLDLEGKMGSRSWTLAHEKADVVEGLLCREIRAEFPRAFGILAVCAGRKVVSLNPRPVGED